MSEPQILMRAATLDDVETIALLGASFFEEAGWSDVTAWDHDSICATLCNLISEESGIVLVCEANGRIVGMGGGLVHPAYFNRNHITGQELFMWVEPAFRRGIGGDLLDALEDQAALRGARSWAVASVAKLRPEAVGRLYERRGYRPSERTYIKALAA